MGEPAQEALLTLDNPRVERGPASKAVGVVGDDVRERDLSPTSNPAKRRLSDGLKGRLGIDREDRHAPHGQTNDQDPDRRRVCPACDRSLPRPHAIGADTTRDACPARAGCPWLARTKRDRAGSAARIEAQVRVPACLAHHARVGISGPSRGICSRPHPGASATTWAALPSSRHSGDDIPD